MGGSGRVVMATVQIRPMVATDVEAAGRLEESVYSQPWSTDVFAEELQQPNRTYLAVEVDGRLVGYGGVMVVDTEAHMTTVVVDPAYRNERLGTRLMMALVDSAHDRAAQSLTLEVRVSNDAAQALYRRFGMAPVGVRKQYYRDEDALIMWAHDIRSPDYAERLDRIREDLS